MGTGISGLLCITGDTFHKRRDWSLNLSLNKWPEARRLMARQEKPIEFLSRIRTPYKLSIVEITKISSNDNMIAISDLYPERSKAYVGFVLVGGHCSLLVIGSKTLKEYTLFGNDNYQKSKVPFLLNEKFESLNLFLE